MSEPAPASTADEQTPMGTPTGRRRAAVPHPRRFTMVDVLAVAVPLATAAVVALVSGPLPAAAPLKPEVVPRERSTLVCAPASGHVRVASADPGASGTVELREPSASIDISAGRAVSVEALRGAPAQAVIVGTGAMAPGLLAARVDGDPSTCSEPAPDYYFAGVGAGPEHASTLQLVNPDGGTAVADITVHGPDGVLDVPSLRGVAVRGGRTLDLKLASIVPSLDSLGLHVAITRGRLGATVRDTHDPLGAGPTRSANLAAQPEPTDTVYLAGVSSGPAQQQLTVFNPADSESVVSLKIVSQRAEFAPVGIEPLRVPARSTAVLDVSEALRGQAAAQVVGLRLDSTHPVVASLRRSTDKTWRLAPAVSPVTAAATLLPRETRQRLVLQAVARTGVAVVETRDRSGRDLGVQRLELTPGEAVVADLPARVATVSVTLERTSAAGAVVSSSGVVPLSELQQVTQRPQVSPALF